MQVQVGVNRVTRLIEDMPWHRVDTNRRLRVLQVITRSERGGAQAVVGDLIAGLSSQVDFHVAVGLDTDHFLASRAADLGIPVTGLRYMCPTVKPATDLWAIAELVQTIRRIKPDLVHCHSSKAGILGRAAARITNVPSVFTAHGWAFSEGVSKRRRQLAIAAERMAGRWVETIMTVSESDRKLASKLHIVDEKKMITVHNGVPDTPQRSTPATSQLTNIVVVARFAPQKDHFLLLKSISRLGHRRFTVTLVGDGPELLRVKEFGARLGLADRLHFTGSRKDVDHILAQSHLFVLPSNWEGLPISVIEAMRAGLPVIASDVGGCRELVVNGETGFLTPRGGLTELTDRLGQLILDPELRGTFGRAARVRYEKHFTLDKMLSKVLRIYVSFAQRQ